MGGFLLTERGKMMAETLSFFWLVALGALSPGGGGGISSPPPPQDPPPRAFYIKMPVTEDPGGVEKYPHPLLVYLYQLRHLCTTGGGA